MTGARFGWLAAVVLNIGLLGCGPDLTMAVTPTLVWSADALDFGDRAVLDDVTLPVRLQNVGAAGLEISAMRIEGDDAFTVVDPLDELQGGAEREVLVQFLPSEMGSYEATLIIESDDEDNPRVEIALTGRGTTVAVAVIDPLVLDFGRVGESRTVVRRVRITSTGTADLKIRSIAFSEDTSAAYGFVGSTRTPQSLPARVAGGEDTFAEITVKFSPTAEMNETQGTLVLETTSPDHTRVEIELLATVNQQPIAIPGNDQMVPPGDRVDLDGSESYDPDGDDPIVFNWELVESPEGSSAVLEGANTASPSIVTDEPGHYAIELVVTDTGGLSSVPERVSVIAESSDRLRVRLTWDHAIADLDLHMRPVGEAFEGPYDCYGYQPTPDWGVEGNPDDNPFHTGDRLSGWGPETIVYEEPVDGRYEIAVKFSSAQGSADTNVPARVQIYMYGQVQQQFTRTMATAGEIWNVGVVEWPTGAVTGTETGTP